MGGRSAPQRLECCAPSVCTLEVQVSPRRACGGPRRADHASHCADRRNQPQGRRLALALPAVVPREVLVQALLCRPRADRQIQTPCPLHFSSSDATLFHPQTTRLGPQGPTVMRPTIWIRRSSQTEAWWQKASRAEDGCQAPGGAREQRVLATQLRQSSTTVVHRFRKAGVAGSNPAFGSIQATPCHAPVPGEGSLLSCCSAAAREPPVRLERTSFPPPRHSRCAPRATRRSRQ